MSLVSPPLSQSLAEAGLALVGVADASPAPVASTHPLARRRLFDVQPAIREPTPLLLGLTGPSGSGKTYSALRLATGIARTSQASGGSSGIVVIDTENRRARHYADQFAFSHIDFAPPYGSLDYLDALHTAAATNPAVIIVDSLSHEHDGEGGMLDAVTAELDRIAGSDPVQQQRLAAAAWRRPKTARRALLSGLLRLKTHIILCMRASERTRVARETQAAEVTEMGFTPVAGPEFLFELTCCALLRPGVQGTPTWASQLPGEHAAIKLPRQFEGIFATSEPLSESHGEQLARWAAGEAAPPVPPRRKRRGRRATGPAGA
ncbi:MAG: AAA family ATPase [Novosphingobium sp.]|nr:AAA family ATPase [Novosphingobium sp.]